MWKKFLGKINIFDLIIILAIIAIVSFAFIKTTDESDNIQKVSFDGSEMNKVFQKYGEYYSEGKLVKAKISGTDKSGEMKEYEGTVRYCDENQIVISTNGKKIIGSYFINSKYCDLYLKSVGLSAEKNPDKITVITIKPMNISNFDELIIKSTDKKYYIKTDISMDETFDYSKVQEIDNELYSKLKLPSIQADKYGKSFFILRNTGSEELKIANTIMNNFNGKTNYIYINIYNASSEDIENIKKQFDVESVNTIN